MSSVLIRFVLALAAASGAAAQTSFVHPYCNMKGAVCITYLLDVHAHGIGDDMHQSVDRLYVMLNADQCQVPVGSFGAMTTVQGMEHLGETSIVTPVNLTWRVPANCPYKMHLRHQEPFPFTDYIVTDSINADVAKKNYCLSVNLYAETKSSGCN